MNPDLFAALEQAIRGRNPVLAGRLRPGRSESFIRRRLTKEGVSGCVEPVVGLFSWKDGSDLDASVTQDQLSPFPGSGYFMFMPFTFIVGHFDMFKDFAKHHENMMQVAGRYFPLFWNGSKGIRDWLAVDLSPASGSRVVFIDSHADEPVYPAHSTFDDFLADAIRANRENTSLRCL
jgi:hypothetical protein